MKLTHIAIASLLVAFSVSACNAEPPASSNNQVSETPTIKSDPQDGASGLIWKHYNQNPDFSPTTLPNGSVANATEVMKAGEIYRGTGDVRTIKVTENTWMIAGLFYGPVVIESENGLLVFNTGESAEDGRIFRELIRKDISRKPVIAVFYDHAHYPKGTETLLDGDEAEIYAHPDHNEILEISGGAGNPNIEEMKPEMDARAAYHLGNYMPPEGADANPGLSLDMSHASAWLPATRVLEDGEEIVVDGVKIQAFHAITDTEDSLTFWLPEYKMVIDNVVWPTANMYTIRGDRYRDPQNWISALKKIRSLEPEIILAVGGGSFPLEGKENCFNTVSGMIDLMSYIYDQSIRFTNMGVSPSELKHYIRVPESILSIPNNNQFYGQFDVVYQNIPTYNVGWFSGFPEDLHSLPNEVMAEKLIALAGGPDKIVALYDQAMQAAEYLWAKELAVQLYRSNPGNQGYRQALADVFRKLAQYSPSSSVRNFYLSGSLSLEGDKAITVAAIQSADWVMSDIPRAINHLRVRIDPDKAGDIEGVLAFSIDGQNAALHTRNGVAEYVPDLGKHYRKEDARITADKETFASYFRGEINAEEFLAKAELTNERKAKDLLAVFDIYQERMLYPEQNTLH
jgi:alkyl sulfatase BDS1-like metallo-beta-lactamase superfamily hydrolase